MAPGTTAWGCSDEQAQISTEFDPGRRTRAEARLKQDDRFNELALPK